MRPFLISLAATLVFVAIVLASAGRLTVWQAWVYAGISLALNVGQRTILRTDPELAKERAKPGASARPSDKALLGVGLLLDVAMLVTLLVRTHLEDALLTKELDGYRAYRQRTRFRLVPGLW